MKIVVVSSLLFLFIFIFQFHLKALNRLGYSYLSSESMVLSLSALLFHQYHIDAILRSVS